MAMMDPDDPASQHSGDRQAGPRIAVVFFGITRSLRLTNGSIQRCLIAPARAVASDLRTVGHFFAQDRIDNPRSQEAGPLDPDEFQLLGLDEVEREPPGQCLELHGFERLKAAGDPWRDGFVSLRNLVHQLHSLARATDLALAWKPDVVIFARPDLYYHDSVAPHLAAISLAARAADVLVPDWAQWRGLNDRFAIACGAPAISAYGGRVTRLDDYAALGKPVHSERFLKFALQGLAVGCVPMRASRVRSNGVVVVEDFSPGRGQGGALGLQSFSDFEQSLTQGQPELAGQAT